MPASGEVEGKGYCEYGMAGQSGEATPMKTWSEVLVQGLKWTLEAIHFGGNILLLYYIKCDKTLCVAVPCSTVSILLLKNLLSKMSPAISAVVMMHVQ